MRGLQINRLFWKPICKPDAARKYETGETEPTERDEICPVRRGHRTRQRRLETAETDVVWLITQGRGFKSLPRYQGQGPFGSARQRRAQPQKARAAHVEPQP